LKELPGISNVQITFTTARTVITHKPATIGLRAIVEKVEALGYNALVADSDDNNAQLESLAKTKEIQEWRTAFRKHTLADFSPGCLCDLSKVMHVAAMDRPQRFIQ
jgi:hypothetical protein